MLVPLQDYLCVVIWLSGSGICSHTLSQHSDNLGPDCQTIFFCLLSNIVTYSQHCSARDNLMAKGPSKAMIFLFASLLSTFVTKSEGGSPPRGSSRHQTLGSGSSRRGACCCAWRSSSLCSLPWQLGRRWEFHLLVLMATSPSNRQDSLRCQSVPVVAGQLVPLVMN